MAPPRPGPATRKRSGSITTPEESQDIKSTLDGRKFLEKYTLLCPPGEPMSNRSLAYCLHQISAMSGVPKQAINAIRASAFLLEELEETAINETIRIVFDSQITELTLDMKILVEDTGVKVDQRIKESFEQVIKDLKQAQPPPGFGTQNNTPARNTPGVYPHPCISPLVNPPPISKTCNYLISICKPFSTFFHTLQYFLIIYDTL